MNDSDHLRRLLDFPLHNHLIAFVMSVSFSNPDIHLVVVYIPHKMAFCTNCNEQRRLTELNQYFRNAGTKEQ